MPYRDSGSVLSTLNTQDTTAMKTLTAFIAACWLSLPTAYFAMWLLGACDIISSLVNPKVQFRRRITVVALSMLLATMVHASMYYLKHGTDINLGIDIASGVCAFYALSSAIQTLLNFAAAGVPIPPVLVGLMIKAKGLTNEEKKELKQIARDSANMEP